MIVRGTPWDPWTAPWQAFLRLVGEDKYLLYVFGKYCGASYNCNILFIISSISFFKGLVANESLAPGSKPKITCSTGTVAVTTLHFWISAAFYLYLDLTGKPGFLYK